MEKYTTTDKKLSKEYWRLKELKAQPQVQFYVLKSTGVPCKIKGGGGGRCRVHDKRVA